MTVMDNTRARPTSSQVVDVALLVQLAGFALLILFASTFGVRWALLASSLVLLFLGWVLSGVTVTVALPARPDGAGAGAGGGR